MKRFTTFFLVTLFATLVMWQLTSQTARGAVEYQKYIAPTGVLTADGQEIILWHDYGSFALYRISNEKVRSLSDEAQRQLTNVSYMDRILIDAYPFNTQKDTVNVPTTFKAQTQTGKTLHLVQFVGPIKDAWLQEVEQTGAQLVHYVNSNAYIVFADASSRAKLDAFAAQQEFVQYSGAYQPYFKLGETLRTRFASPSVNNEEVILAAVQVVNHPNIGTTQDVIGKTAVSTQSEWSDVLAYKNIIVELRLSDIAELAHRPDVVWIGERMERTLNDEVQNQIIAGNFNGTGTGPSGPGYMAWLTGHGFSSNPADYPIVDVVDDGIGNGTINSGDRTFHVGGNIANPTRLAYVSSCHSSPSGEGPDGHGHINTSIVGGYDNTAGFPFTDPNGYLRGLGINPFARMAGTRIFAPGFDLGGCGGTDAGLIKHTQDNGALISSNSWGCSGCASQYDDSSQAFDVGTRDADTTESGNQELLFIFAAGNSGSSAGTVGTPGNGKNMVTVGASENVRPNDESGSWTDGCGVDSTGADNAMDIIGFSSRGPAPGNRVKPEVIAPGTHIQGTASTNASYNGSGVCDQFRPGSQTVFAASSGTSHSTPAVAGVSSLAYYWLENTLGVDSPSPATSKAYLIAHPTYLTGVSASGNLPTNSQGYGMPNMGLMFDDAIKYIHDQEHLLDNTGETWTWNGAVADPSKPVRIVMVYTDQAGAIGTSPQVNNLNLAATVGSTTYLGNVFSGAFSTSGGSADNSNNYEAIFLPAGTTGSIELTVSAANIAGDGVPNTGDGTDQDFAIVCYNCASFPDFTVSATPNNQLVCAPDDAEYLVEVGSILGYTTNVALSATGNPAGTTTNFSVNNTTNPYTSTLTIGNTGSATAGSYEIAITGQGATSTHTVTVGLDLFTAPPATVSLQTPTNGATNVAIPVNFTWTAATQASSYLLEVATDAAFTNIVHSSTEATNSASVTGLDTATIYFWRVTADNICGTGTTSAVFTFSTIPAPGDCNIGETTVPLFSEGFEAGAPGWTSSGTGNTWAQSSARVHSGSFSHLAVNSSTVSDQRLVSPPITIDSGLSNYSLLFWNHQTIEDSSTGCFDGAIVEVSTDGGTNWTQLTSSSDPYDGLVASNFSNPLGGLQAWCGDPRDWHRPVVDLSAYEGDTVNFRFRLGTDSSVAREGWYLDDVAVQACSADGVGGVDVDADVTSANADAGETVAYTVHITNTSDLTTTDVFDISVMSSEGWPAVVDTTVVTLAPGASTSVEVEVTVPLTATAGTVDTTTVTAVSQSDPFVNDSVELETTVNGPAIEVNPAEVEVTIGLTSTATQTVTIMNVGGSDLMWEIVEANPTVRLAAPAGVGVDRATNALGYTGVAAPAMVPAAPNAPLMSLAEGFDDITTLPGAGWAQTNNSNPLGITGWFQGNDTVFPAFEGAPTSYIGANFNSTAGTGTISNWLITPELTLHNGATVSFYTRIPTGQLFPDRLELRMSTAGSSTDVGTTETSVGDFATLLLSVNPDLGGDYPTAWTQFTATISGLSGPTQGRLAFRYFVTNGGPNGANSNYIGIDSFNYTAADAPDACAENDIPWLSVSPTSGTTPMDGSDEVSVMFDSTGYAGGVYTATLCINSNDPAMPEYTVPVTMTVIENATYGMEVMADTMEMTGTVGTTITYTIWVTNTGNVNDTFAVELSNHEWTTWSSHSSINLAPGEMGMFMVMVSVPATATHGITDTTMLMVTSQGDDTVSEMMHLTTTAVVPAPAMMYIYLPVINREP